MGGRGGSSHAGTARTVDTSILSRYTTTKEVSQWLKRQKWFTPRSEINLEGIAVDAAKSIAMAYKRVFEAYPQVIGKFRGIVALPLGPYTYAQCYLQSGRIEVNRDFYADIAYVDREYKENVRHRFHPPGTTWESVVTHEIGHAINGYLDEAVYTYNRQQILNNGFQNAQTIHLNYVEQWKTDIYASHNLPASDPFVTRHNSGYATENKAEWFAESFAEGFDSANPRWAAKMFMDKLNELMKKVK